MPFYDALCFGFGLGSDSGFLSFLFFYFLCKFSFFCVLFFAVCVCVASIASMWRKINATRLLKIGCLHVYQLSSGNRIPLYDMPNENDAHLLSVIVLWGHLKKTNNKLERREFKQSETV